MSVWDELKHFRPYEFNEPAMMEEKLLRRLDEARTYAGIPFILSSTYRGGDPLSHGLGKAVDIATHNSTHRMLIVSSLVKAGFRRIGVYDKHTHADTATEEDGFPQDVMWWDRSK